MVSNKINGLDNRSSPLGAGRAVERARDAATGDKRPASEASSSSGVHITNAAQQLAVIEQRLKDLPAIDEARVSEIRTALEQGSYKVSAERIADQLIQLDQVLEPLYGER
jgi:negative regulator of flagellin synthesis FlgM